MGTNQSIPGLIPRKKNRNLLIVLICAEIDQNYLLITYIAPRRGATSGTLVTLAHFRHFLFLFSYQFQRLCPVVNSNFQYIKTSS